MAVVLISQEDGPVCALPPLQCLPDLRQGQLGRQGRGLQLLRQARHRKQIAKVFRVQAGPLLRPRLPEDRLERPRQVLGEKD